MNFDDLMLDIASYEPVINIVLIVLQSTLKIGTIIFALIYSILKLKIRKNQQKYLNLKFDESTKGALKNYIPTRAQFTDPCDDSISCNQAAKPIKLINHFISKEFKTNQNKYYLVLADSGMGKTTFMLKLFLTYYKKIFKKHQIVFLPLSKKSIDDKIKSIQDKSNTILLLDGFDEDNYAVEDYEKRIKQICDETEDLYKVIMTCRTQFFPDNISEPQFTGNIRFTTGNKKESFIKYYISPFSNNDIKLFLNKKFRFSIIKKFKAKKMISKCQTLMMRPLLLSYINDLLEENKIYTYTYEIYSELVEKWIERESIPNEELLSFTRQLTRLMFLEKQCYCPNSALDNLCKEFELKIKPIDMKAKSLLNRNAEGYYKFAHKSIYEYFLATIAYSDKNIRRMLFDKKFIGLNMTEMFLTEMCSKKASVIFSIKAPINMYYYKYNKLKIKDIDLRFNFSYCDFSNCSFKNVEIINTKLTNCTFNKCNFNSSTLLNINTKCSHFISCVFEECTIEQEVASFLLENSSELINVEIIEFGYI